MNLNKNWFYKKKSILAIIAYKQSVFRYIVVPQYKAFTPRGNITDGKCADEKKMICHYLYRMEGVMYCKSYNLYKRKSFTSKHVRIYKKNLHPVMQDKFSHLSVYRRLSPRCVVNPLHYVGP